MVDLDACYFCGDIGETLRRHDVLPAAVAPSEAEQRTVVLCHRCHRKLRAVVEPLVEALDGQESSRATPTAAPGDDETTTATAASADPTGRDPVADEYDDAPATPPATGVEGGESVASDSEDAGETALDVGRGGRGSEGAPDVVDDAAADPMTASTSDDDDEIEISIPRPERGDDAETDDPDGAGGAVELTDATGASGADAGGGDAEGPSAEPADEPETDADGSAATEGPSAGPADEPETDAGGPAATEGASDGDGAGTTATAPERPAGYHKTLRFLRNRDLPMPRADAEELVASAYDMDASQCRRVLDVAIEDGVLVEDDGQIRRA
jgi:hypothetical protein